MESIVFELPPFNIFKKGDILKSCYDPFFNEVKDAYKTHNSTCESLGEQLRGLSNGFEVTTVQARIPINLQILEHLRIAAAFMQICALLSTLRLFLEKINPSSTDLFGAALFDYPNLLDQIKHLRKQRLPCQFSESQVAVVSAKLCDLKVPTNNRSSADWIPSNESGIARKIQPCYELLQHHITACENKEEVKMRVRLVLSYFNAIRSFPDSIKTRPSTTDDSYLQYQDQQTANRDKTMKTSIEDYERQMKLRQIVAEQAGQHFESLATRYPGDNDISALISEYKTALEDGEQTSNSLKTTTENASAMLEESKPQTLANKM